LSEPDAASDLPRHLPAKGDGKQEVRRPLAGMKIIDLVTGPLAPATRYLADLGASVTHIALEDYDPQTREGLKLFAAHTGKQMLRLDPAAPEVALELIATADAVVIDSRSGSGALPPFQPEAIRARFPEALILTGSDFGQGNSCSQWQASDPVLHALTGELSRSGIRGLAPLLPPGELAIECAAAQFAWVILVALAQRLQGSSPDSFDFAMLDGAMHALDPGYGISGSATLGRPAKLLSPSRPPRGFMYPILPCRDGYVRICLLSARQWRGMFDWMGRPDEFASPDFERVAFRYKSTTLIPAIRAFFADQTKNELEAGARKHGVPLSALLDADEAITARHFAERRTFRKITAPDGSSVTLPNGVIEIDRHRMVADPSASATTRPTMAKSTEPGLPLSGLKVLDLGVIVVGGEQSRLLADLGADVVKIESRAFPDGTRQTDLEIGMSVSFAAGHRNKRSLGLNLRSAEGKALFERLVATADVVLTNFKPGTLESLGFGYEQLAAINPGIIVVESSAFGATGPWAGRMGYGPLVRAATGLTGQWRYPGDPEGFCDSVTIYPDHVGGRVTAIGVLALLIDRARAGRGGLIQSAQSEIILAHQGWQIAARVAGMADPWKPQDAPWGVFPCAGDDAWCVVTVRGDADWQALCGVVPGLNAELDRANRLAAQPELEQRLCVWLAERSAEDAMATLQAAGVPAAQMLRVAELPDFASFAERKVFREVTHPYLAEPFHTEACMALGQTLAAPRELAAPLAGEQTAEVMRDWLGLTPAEVDAHVASGALEPLSDEIKVALAAMGFSELLSVD
jgi:crotonobetainyl-CoA:carnitine CoA-transferase CaiB-like acyl-CoA transferase